MFSIHLARTRRSVACYRVIIIYSEAAQLFHLVTMDEWETQIAIRIKNGINASPNRSRLNFFEYFNISSITRRCKFVLRFIVDRLRSCE